MTKSNDGSNGKKAAARRRKPDSATATVATEKLDEIYTRLADSAAALNATHVAEGPQPEQPPDSEIWAAEAGAKEEEEPELEEEKDFEGESVDDPVRMYLREIGKVYLLSGADEKRLARQMEEGKHIQAIEQEWDNVRGEGPAGGEILFSLLEQLHQER